MTTQETEQANCVISPSLIVVGLLWNIMEHVPNIISACQAIAGIVSSTGVVPRNGSMIPTLNGENVKIPVREKSLGFLDICTITIV